MFLCPFARLLYPQPTQPRVNFFLPLSKRSPDRLLCTDYKSALKLESWSYWETRWSKVCKCWGSSVSRWRVAKIWRRRSDFGWGIFRPEMGARVFFFLTHTVAARVQRSFMGARLNGTVTSSPKWNPRWGRNTTAVLSKQILCAHSGVLHWWGSQLSKNSRFSLFLPVSGEFFVLMLPASSRKHRTRASLCLLELWGERASERARESWTEISPSCSPLLSDGTPTQRNTYIYVSWEKEDARKEDKLKLQASGHGKTRFRLFSPPLPIH